MEGHFEVEICLRLQYSLLGRDRNDVAVVIEEPVLLDRGVSKVVDLHLLRIAGIDHHCPELHHVVHQLDFGGLAGPADGGQEAGFLALNLNIEVAHEPRHSGKRIEFHIDGEDPSGFEHTGGGGHRQEVVVQLPLVLLFDFDFQIHFALVE